MTSSNTVDAKSRMGALRTLLAQRNHIARGMNDMRRSTINTNVSEDDHYGAAAAGNANLRTERDGEQDQRQRRRERRRRKRRRRRRRRRSHGALRYRRPARPAPSPPRHEERWEQQPPRRRGARFTWNSKALATMPNSVNGMAITTTTMQHMMEMQKQEDKEKRPA